MAHDARVRGRARQLYIQERLALPVISVKLDVPMGTLRRWKTAAKETGDDWDIAKSALALQGEGRDAIVADVVDRFLAIYHVTIQSIEDSTLEVTEKVKQMTLLADSFSKMMNGAGKASPQMSRLAIAMDVLAQFANFIAEEHPDLSQQFLEVIEPFGEKLAQVYHAAP
ncbi:MAG: DUF1804 family protein [Paracoccus sp. (in: a-proteobacteria)]|uniref:DUF1804 family protein n=1 Tax=Paracoccus sp. TaxID=267 RepID=UPI0026E0F69A|nr:DUF1804 family protein [Paracoccus sp. (in: a-proteobacteria)]MDO5614438.1 DUF1804 family protein [Paracoccus sp. (in: a-proteobacteria)]